jgi:hypothetical protein
MLLLPIFAALVKEVTLLIIGEVDEWLKSTVC